MKNEHRETQADWRELLEHVKSEGKRELRVQRYKGLGEMNAEQLGETTMNSEKRTLLKVRLEDVVRDRRDLLHADGRGRGEPAQVHRRERAGREESGRVETGGDKINSRLSYSVFSNRKLPDPESALKLGQK